MLSGISETLQADAKEPSPNKTYNVVTSHQKAPADALPLQPKHQQRLLWKSNSIETQRSNVKETSIPQVYKRHQ